MAKGKYRNKTSEPTATALDAACLSPGENGAAALADADFAYQAAAAAAGKPEKTYGIWGPIWRLVEWVHSKKVEHTVNKKTYLVLLVLLGWIGGHRWYEHRTIVALFYTAFFWTGFPLAMCIIDAMIVIPKKADENGCIVL